MKKALCAALIALMSFCVLPLDALAEDLSVTIAADGTTATVTGDASGLFVRAALVIDNNGETGLLVTQAVLNDNGVIVIPAFQVPGLTVRGISVALVRSMDEITSPTPAPAAFASRIDGREISGGSGTSPEVFRLTLEAGEGGTIPAGLEEQISGHYEAGAQVSVIAREMPGFRFLRWTTSGGGSFADETDSQTVFTMPAQDIVVTAVFAAL